MSVATSTAIIIGGGLAAAGGVASAAIGSSAASSAAQQQQKSAQQALDYTKSVSAPYTSAGATSIGGIMTGLQNGTFGAGSLPAFTPPPAFKAPTEEEAAATPGYQFTKDQGDLGISRQAAAAGGAFTGGTLKAGATFDTGLANATYGDTFNRTFATHQSQFNDSLQAYQESLLKQQQEFGQLFAPAQLGAGVATGTSQNVSNLLVNQGNAGAAGTVGSANAITGGINSATSGILQSYLLSQLTGPGGGAKIPAGWTSTPNGNIPPPQAYIP